MHNKFFIQVSFLNVKKKERESLTLIYLKAIFHPPSWPRGKRQRGEKLFPIRMFIEGKRIYQAHKHNAILVNVIKIMSRDILFLLRFLDVTHKFIPFFFVS